MATRGACQRTLMDVELTLSACTSRGAAGPEQVHNSKSVNQSTVAWWAPQQVTTSTQQQQLVKLKQVFAL